MKHERKEPLIEYAAFDDQPFFIRFIAVHRDFSGMNQLLFQDSPSFLRVYITHQYIPQACSSKKILSHDATWRRTLRLHKR
jgi:hypothetical protein